MKDVESGTEIEVEEEEALPVPDALIGTEETAELEGEGEEVGKGGKKKLKTLKTQVGWFFNYEMAADGLNIEEIISHMVYLIS